MRREDACLKGATTRIVEADMEISYSVLGVGNAHSMLTELPLDIDVPEKRQSQLLNNLECYIGFALLSRSIGPREEEQSLEFSVAGRHNRC